jgi:hypothetical protein
MAPQAKRTGPAETNGAKTNGAKTSGAKTSGSKRPASPAKPKTPSAAQTQAKPKAPSAAQTQARSKAAAAAPAQAPEPAAQLPAAQFPVTGRPAALWLAAAAQGLEAAGLGVAAVFAGLSTADGKSYQLGSGVALTLIAVAVAAGLAVIAVGLARARPWSRIPAVMTQLFVVIAGVTLLQGHRTEWGAPALVLAAACVAGLLTPASVRALNRPPSAPAESEPAESEPATSKRAASKASSR